MLRGVLDLFPEVNFAMAYGSMVYRQANHPGQGMVDFVFAVDDAQAWHAANLRHNPGHYAALCRWAGPAFVARVQRNISAQLYYNTLVPVAPAGADSSFLIKYGVIQTDDLARDLQEWTTLYVSGRMHKPVAIVKADERLREPIRRNLRGAAAAALLQELGDPGRPGGNTTLTVGALDFFSTVAALSYTGDFRMAVGEHPDKVRNIVAPHVRAFAELYAPHLEALGGQLSRDSGGNAEVRLPRTAATRSALVRALPQTLQARVLALRGASDGAVAAEVGGALSNTVARAARAQSLKGVLTAGLGKSVVYAAQKLGKRWR